MKIRAIRRAKCAGEQIATSLAFIIQRDRSPCESGGGGNCHPRASRQAKNELERSTLTSGNSLMQTQKDEAAVLPPPRDAANGEFLSLRNDATRSGWDPYEVIVHRRP